MNDTPRTDEREAWIRDDLRNQPPERLLSKMDGYLTIMTGLARILERELSAPSASGATTPGWVMVPLEPTEEMIQAAIHCLDGVNLKAIPGNATYADIKRYKPIARYKAMLSAAERAAGEKR